MGRNNIPSEDIGDYEEYRKKKSPPKTGPLYPLDEEGSFGAPPSALPPPLPEYQKRGRKTKVYTSYAASSDCGMHADKLEQNEKERGKTPPQTGGKKQSTSSYNSLTRSSSQSRARSNSVRLPSPAPSVDAYGSKSNWKNSLRSSDSPARSYRAPSAPQTPQRKISRPQRDSVLPNRNQSVAKSPERKTRQSESPVQSLKTSSRSVSSDGMSNRSSPSSTDWGYTSYSSFTAHKTSSYTQKSSSSSSTMRDTCHAEPDYGCAGVDQARLSIGVTRPPGISPWDNMGILGLSSKMYSDTSNMKEGILSSSSLMRRESVNTHAM